MNFTSILDILIAGLLLGGLYALIAMGMSLQYGVARVFNVAHGEFIMLGAMTTWSMFTIFHINPLLSIVIAGPLAFLVGYILHSTFFMHLRNSMPRIGEISLLGVFISLLPIGEKQYIIAAVIIILAVALDIILNKTVFKRSVPTVFNQGAFESNSMLFSFGLMFIIMNIAYISWGPEYRGLSYLATTVNIGGALFGANRLVTLAFAVAIGLAFYFFLVRTRMGKAIRASASDATTAGLMGVNIHSVLAICFGLGAAMAAIAGVLISLSYTLNANMGMEYTIISVIVVALGGLGSIPGSFIGGFILGIIGSIVAYIDPGLSLVAYYVIFILLLLVRPTGIMGK
jgi:branched-chain amino acid transport system permease protein